MHQRVRPALLYTLACTGIVTLSSGLYWIIDSDRANIYFWCVMFNVSMLYGIVQCVRVSRFFDILMISILSITITAAILYVHGKLASPVIIPA
ncbi:hypothetical protein D3C72_2033750 [compost metagenome]